MKSKQRKWIKPILYCPFTVNKGCNTDCVLYKTKKCRIAQKEEQECPIAKFMK